MKRLVFGLALALAACGPGVKGGPSMNNKIGAQEYKAPTSSVVSEDILAREPVANTASVKHILISWDDLHDAFDGRQDPRAQKRSMTEAETAGEVAARPAQGRRRLRGAHEGQLGGLRQRRDGAARSRSRPMRSS